ncbi:uncharacterized protein ACNS7B_000213, partial [Menidia menidia]
NPPKIALKALKKSFKPVLDAARGSPAQPLRNKSKKRSAYGSNREEEEEEEEKEEEEEEERDPEASDQEEEDPGQPKDYKDLDKHVQSFRYDVIVKAGLDVARK